MSRGKARPAAVGGWLPVRMSLQLGERSATLEDKGGKRSTDKRPEFRSQESEVSGRSAEDPG